MFLSPDVTEILDDPDVGGGQPFVSIRTIRRRTLRSGTDEQIIRTPCTGNVQPNGMQQVNHTDQEGSHDVDIVVRSKHLFELGRELEDGIYQLDDELEWHGKRYRVTSVDDWSEWGFTTAYAILRKDVNV